MVVSHLTCTFVEGADPVRGLVMCGAMSPLDMTRYAQQDRDPDVTWSTHP